MPKRREIGGENLIGQRVVALRKEKHINQKELLARLQTRGIEIGQSGLSELEGQKRKVSDRELLALAESLEVSVNDLLKPKE